MAGDVGSRVVEALVLDQFVQPGLGFAAQAGFFLLLPLGFDAFVLLALRADRIRLGQIDVFLRARLALPLRAAVRGLGAVRRPAGMAGRVAGRVANLRTGLRRPALRAAVAAGIGLALGFGRGFETQPQELVAESVAHAWSTSYQ